MAHNAPRFSLREKNSNKPFEVASSRSNSPPTFPSRLFKIPVGCVTVFMALCLACRRSTTCQHVKIHMLLVVLKISTTEFPINALPVGKQLVSRNSMHVPFALANRESHSYCRFGHFIPGNFTVLGFLNNQLNEDNFV